MKTKLEQLLEDLTASGAVGHRMPLHHLSNLMEEESQHVSAAWSTWPVALRRQLITRLVELAESDFEMDFGALFRLALDDEDAQVRCAAVEGLWEDEDVRLVPRFVTCLLEDEDPAVRAAAAVSLGRFVLLGELQKIRPRPFALAYSALLQSCRATDQHPEVWRRALESLAYVNNEEVAELIEQAYAADDEKLRVSAVFAMGRSANRRWAVQVRQEMFSPNPEMRYESARACGEIVLKEAVPDLEELAADADPEVQEAALWALGQIGGERARRILQRYCADDDEATRAAAEAAMAEFEFLHGELSDLFGRLDEEAS